LISYFIGTDQLCSANGNNCSVHCTCYSHQLNQRRPVDLKLPLDDNCTRLRQMQNKKLSNRRDSARRRRYRQLGLHPISHRLPVTAQ